MRATLSLDRELLENASLLTGIKGKSALVRFALEELLRRESSRQLAALGGTASKLTPVPRRRGTRVNMISKLSVLLLLAVSICAACECSEQSVEVKRDSADIIFRGTIVQLRKTSKSTNISVGFGRDLKETIVFRVSRVWKGQVGQVFEMRAIEETAACWGFWPDFLKVAQDLLVYAKSFQGSEYLTSICGYHKPAKIAEEDLKILGSGKEPARLTQIQK